MLGQPLIGTGGWAYFMIPGKDSLSSYSQLFNFVEINSTFYELPKLSLVRSWRQRAPADFQFSVRCHRDITHRYMLEPNGEALGLYERMIEICSILQANFILLQTPRSFRFNQEKFRYMKEFFSTTTNGPRVVLEIRRENASPLPKELLGIMQDQNIVHCTDVSVEMPAYDSDVIYTRLFGPGNSNIYQFTDEEMKKIDARTSNASFEKSVLAFHGVKMYKDAARFSIFKKTSIFLSITSATGMESLKEVLSEDAVFPSSKQELVTTQGWKLIDLTEDKRVHASFLLMQLPSRVFTSVDDVAFFLQEKVPR